MERKYHANRIAQEEDRAAMRNAKTTSNGSGAASRNWRNKTERKTQIMRSHRCRRNGETGGIK